MSGFVRVAGLLACVLLCIGPTSPGAAPVFDYVVIDSMPHDPAAFTQGLLFDGGVLYESTGGYGESSLRRVQLANGKVLARTALRRRVFAEGLALLGGELFQLTWRSGLMPVYRRDDFKPLRVLRYEGEGWGLTTDGQRLLMSDGSSTLAWRDARTAQVLDTVEVVDDGTPVRLLNELEWLPGRGDDTDHRVLANVWTSDRIAVIDPRTGTVDAWIDLEGLMRGPYRLDDDAVLNGIAFDADARRLYVTGKRWPRLFEIWSPALANFMDRPARRNAN